MRQVAAYAASPKTQETMENSTGMEEFFVEQIKIIKGDLFRVANSILQNYADAEDALSESITRAYQRRHTLRDRDKFKWWMMKILVRECYRLRKSGKWTVVLETLPETAAATEAPAKELWDVVQSLPEEFRIVVVLFYYEDIGTRGIASMLRISEGTVKSRLFRARERLRAFLNEERGE